MTDSPSYSTLAFYRDGNHFCLEARHEKADDFLGDCAEDLCRLLREAPTEGDAHIMAQAWLPQIVEIACKLKGYQAEVVIEQIIRAGAVAPRAEHAVSERGHMRPAAKAESA